MKTTPEFDTAFESFFQGCKQITERHFGKELPWRVERLQKRIRLVRETGVHAFVDYETGDVLMPASWKAPAKHARGNIYDESNGLKHMGPYGPAYLR